MDITMDACTTHGPTTRAQARAIEAKVNSLLSGLPFDTHETGMLPHGDTLCILRYTGDTQGEAKTQGQVTPRRTPREDEDKTPEFLTTPGARPPGPRVPGPPSVQDPEPLTTPGARSPGPRVPGLPCAKTGSPLTTPGTRSPGPRVPGPRRPDLGKQPMYPLLPLDYKYLSPTSELGLAKNKSKT